MNKKLHIILAGGKATRLGILSKGVPKAIMPLGNTTLLHRQVSQSLLAGNNQILIATSDTFANQIKKSIDGYHQVKVISKTNSPKGPLFTLHNILKRLNPETIIILTLGDIYFCHNPFNKLNIKASNNKIYLAGAKAFHPKDLSLGGIVFTEGSKVTSIIKASIPNNKNGYKWSGTAVFKASIDSKLAQFLNDNKNELEDFFEYCRLSNNISFIEIPDFINVNKIDEFHIATLYNLAEVYKNGRRKIFASTADKLRKEYLKKQ